MNTATPLGARGRSVIGAGCNIWIRDVFCYRIPAPLLAEVPTKTRLESSINKFTPHSIYDSLLLFFFRPTLGYCLDDRICTPSVLWRVPSPADCHGAQRTMCTLGFCCFFLLTRVLLVEMMCYAPLLGVLFTFENGHKSCTKYICMFFRHCLFMVVRSAITLLPCVGNHMLGSHFPLTGMQ